jgi:diguanylate cyclase (GGDEF)-like protein
VLFVDLDRFKVVNESLGYSVGDDVLRETAVRLRHAARAADTVARFGGDEFVVVCDGITEHEATALAQRLVEAVRAPLELHGRELSLAASVGVAITFEGCEPEGLLRDASAAMFRAKELGRNCVGMFDVEMHQRALERLDMQTALRRALERDELTLLYQPVVGVEDGRICGVEALVRWDHPTLGRVSPASFIPLAEEIGLIGPIGEWVVRTACTQLAAWSALTPEPLGMAVNLSGRQLVDNSIVEVVRSAVADSGIDPSQLCVEITETVLVEDTATAAAALGELKQIGVRIAVDDFGTGYSSMLHLRRFPVDVLKMDRAFVSGITSDEQDRTIVQATIGLAHALGLQAVAEGVEEHEQLVMLDALGCDVAQGFLWSPPVDPETLEQLVREGQDR